MLQIELMLSNQECAALDAELTDVETVLMKKMMGQMPDNGDTATPAHVAITRILGPIREHLNRLAIENAKDAQRRREKFAARQRQE